MNDMPPKHDLIAARYGLDMPAGGPMTPAIEILLAHRSVRAFLPDMLPDGTLETLVAAASSAATSSNMQQWSVIEVTDPAIRSRLARIAGNQRHVEVAPLFLVWLADLSRQRRLGEALGEEIEGLPFAETFLTALVDTALAAQNAVVAAESLGLGTVYIGAIRNNPIETASLLGLPPGVMPVFGLCVGYPDPAGATGIKPRLPQSVVLHRGRYDSSGEAAGIAAHETALMSYQEGQGLTPVGWVAAVRRRLGTIAGLGGRHTLRETLRSLGFPLQ